MIKLLSAVSVLLSGSLCVSTSIRAGTWEKAGSHGWRAGAQPSQRRSIQTTVEPHPDTAPHTKLQPPGQEDRNIQYTPLQKALEIAIGGKT